MRTRVTASIVALALASTSGSACGMTQPVDKAERCRVSGGEKLPAELGGAAGICAVIEEAASAEAPGADYSVEVRVASPTMLSAVLTLANGQVLPERKLAISDSTLRRSTIEWFAKRLAAEIAKGRA